MSPRLLRRLFNLWPPFLFSGIRVRALSDDWRHARVELRLTWYNRNYVRAQFGGSLFSMTDPFWMMLVMKSLGPRYHVWDQAGTIHFVAPGRENVFAEFHLEQAVIDELHASAASGEKHLRWFDVSVKTADGTLIAKVRKQLYVRLKPEFRPAPPPGSDPPAAPEPP